MEQLFLHPLDPYIIDNQLDLADVRQPYYPYHRPRPYYPYPYYPHYYHHHHPYYPHPYPYYPLYGYGGGYPHY